MRPTLDATTSQVMPDSLMGRMLTELAGEAETIVEIGTWRGLGSTLCLHLGMERSSQRLWTVESDPERWREARGYWQGEPRITLIRGQALEVLAALPPAIDLLLLDGDDSTSYQECVVLAPRSRRVVLDDTTEQKGRASRQELIAAGWKVLADHPEDRLGWSALERPAP